MDTQMTDDGGFPTPPASSVTTSQHPSPLPQPRRRPLKAGSSKESEVIIYLDRGLNNLQKNVDNRMKRGHSKDRTPDTRGYTSFSEVVKELDGLVDVIWISGSLNLQIPYLLTIARMITEFIPLFPASPQDTFRIIDKLDAAFSGLLLGHDIDTGERLPGFEQGRGISTTDKVRLKGIVERTRLVIAKHVKGQTRIEEGDDTTDTEATQTTAYESTTESEGDYVKFEGFDNDDDDEVDEEGGEEEDQQEWVERHVGAIYERTIGELGDVLGGPPIGIITDD